MNPWLSAFCPGHYYYQTRYRFGVQGPIHLLKYWGVFILMLCIYVGPPAQGRLPLMLLAWMAFQSVYDYFAYENDRRASMEAGKGTSRPFEPILPPLQLAIIKVVVVALCGLCGLWFFSESVVARLGLVILACLCVFWLHNRLKPSWRLLSFYSLYMLKSMLVLAVFWDMLQALEVGVFLCFAALFNLSYVPVYIMSKRAGVSVHAVFSTNRSARLLVTPFVYKALIVAGLCIYDTKMWGVCMLLVSVTAVEFVLLKRLRAQA